MYIRALDQLLRPKVFRDHADPEATEPLNDEKCDIEGYADRVSSRRSGKRMLIANIVLFLCSSMVLAKSYLSELPMHGRNGLLKATSAHSPLLSLLDIPLITKRMNGTLMPTNPISIFRQPPSDEVDAAWDRLSTRNPIIVDRSDIVAMGKDPNDAAKWPEDWYGPDKYIGKVDVFHQIHCLDRVRRSLHWNFEHYYGSEFPSGTPVGNYHTSHVDHCVYVLLQNLQCAANVDVYPQFWMDAQDYVFPDFNIDHKCRDFDAILDWQEKNSVDVEELTKFGPGPDSKVHSMSREFKELVRWYDDHPNDYVVGEEIA